MLLELCRAKHVRWQLTGDACLGGECGLEPLQGNPRGGCARNERPEEEAWVVGRPTENLRLPGARCSEPDAVAGFADEVQCGLVRQLAQVTVVVVVGVPWSSGQVGSLERSQLPVPSRASQTPAADGT